VGQDLCKVHDSFKYCLLRDVIDGMTFLHGHDPTILHLDLKADNILLDKGLRAKVIIPCRFRIDGC
jgi:serine/threonine protein kinase